MTNWTYAADVAQVVAAVAQVGATGAATVGLFCLAKQVPGGNRAEDLKALFDFYQRVEDFERRLHLDAHGAERLRIVHELLNFLEVSCEAFLAGLFGKVSASIVRDKLIDSLSLAYADAEVVGAMVSNVTGPTAFSGILKFRSRYDREVDSGTSALRDGGGANAPIEHMGSP